MAKTINNKQSKPKTITVAILEDNATLVKGMMVELDYPDIKICVVGDEVNQFLEGLKSCQPQIAIVDLRIWNDLDAGFVAISKARELSPPTQFIVYTAYDLMDKFHRGINLGVKAFISKNIYEKPLDEVVRIVHNGGTYYGDLLPTYLEKVKEQSVQVKLVEDKSTKNMIGLSKKESEVLELLDKGLSDKEIAGTLVISVNTVKAHTKSIRGKLGVKTTNEAIRIFRLRKDV
jgi:DNA-binding NarL/FixJ family response regulator